MIRKHLTRRAKKHKLKKIIKNVMVIRIQIAYKRYLNKMIDKDERSMRNDKEYNNDTTLIGVELDDINNRYFYKSDKYFFDIRELEGLNKHPYTNKEFSIVDKRQIKRILYNLKSKYYTYRELNEEGEELTLQERYTSYKTDVVKKIEETGVYLPISIFDSYSISEMFYFSLILLNWELIKNIPNINFFKNNIIQTYNKYTYHNYRYLNTCDIEVDFKYSISKCLDYIISINDDNKITRCLIIKNTMIPINIVLV